MRDAVQEAGDVIVARIEYDRALWRRAMTAWWQSVVPPAPFVQRAIFWAIIWVLIGLLAGAVTLFGLTPYYVAAGLVGAGALIAVFTYLQRTRMSRFWNVIGTHWDKAGVTEGRFSADGVELTNAVARQYLSWAAVDAVKGRRGLTVLRSGISMIAVPDSALPHGMTGQGFRDQLREWRSA